MSLDTATQPIVSHFTDIMNEIPAEEEMLITEILSRISDTDRMNIHFNARTAAEKGWINPLTADPEVA